MKRTSNTETFQFLIKNPYKSTVQEYSHVPNPIEKRFKVQLNLVSHILIQLWTPKLECELEHFIPQLNTRAIHQSSPRQVSIEFNKKNVYPSTRFSSTLFKYLIKNHHLGNLASTFFIHYLMQAENPKQKPYISVSNKTGRLFLSHGYQAYWQGYHDNNSQAQSLFFIETILEQYEDVFGPINRKGFIHEYSSELFNIYLRIVLTPWTLIEKIYNEALKNFPSKMTERFLRFLKNRLDTELDFLDLALETTDAQAHKMHRNNDMHRYAAEFKQDLEQFIKKLDFIDSKQMYQFMINHMELSLKYHVPKIEHWCLPHSLQFLPRPLYYPSFIYLQTSCLEHWTKVKNNADHVIWRELDHLSRFLLHRNFCAKIPKMQESFELFILAISYHYNDLAQVLIHNAGKLKDKRLSKISEECDINPIFFDKTPFVIALEHGNYFIASLLVSQFECLSAFEHHFIRSLFEKAILQEQSQSLRKLVEICHKLLKNKTFLERLHQLCQDNAPNLSPYLPLMSIETEQLSARARALVQVNSDSSDSSSSSSDDFHIRFNFTRPRTRSIDDDEPSSIDKLLSRFPYLHKR